MGVPEICLAETFFLWLFSLSVFSLIWSVNPGFYVWAYDSLQVSALVEVNLTDTITVARVQSEDKFHSLNPSLLDPVLTRHGTRLSMD